MRVVITPELLSTVKVLFRRDHSLCLYGVPYTMRRDVGQQPGDLWRAGRTEGWIWLGSPGWWGNMQYPEIKLVQEYLAQHSEEIPQFPNEWCEVSS